MLQTVSERVFGQLAVHLLQLYEVLGVVRVVYHHFLAVYRALDAQSEEAAEGVGVHVGVEHNGVVRRLVREEHRHRHEHGWRKTLAEPDCPHAASRHSVARVVEYVVENEHEHRYEHRQTQAALANDGAERGADEEEDDARQGERDLCHPLYLVLADESVAVVGDERLELEVVLARRHAVKRIAHSGAFLLRRESGVYGVDIV